jgi:hypothetical protein
MEVTSCNEVGDMTDLGDVYSSSPGALDALVPGFGPQPCAMGVFDHYHDSVPCVPDSS